MAELQQLLFPWRDIEICDASMDTPFNENSRFIYTVHVHLCLCAVRIVDRRKAIALYLLLRRLRSYVNVRLLSGAKNFFAVNLFSKLGWELGLYYASYDDFHPDILARMYT